MEKGDVLTITGTYGDAKKRGEIKKIEDGYWNINCQPVEMSRYPNHWVLY